MLCYVGVIVLLVIAVDVIDFVDVVVQIINCCFHHKESWFEIVKVGLKENAWKF